MKTISRAAVIVGLALISTPLVAQIGPGLYGAVRAMEDADRRDMEREAFKLDQQIRAERLRQARELHEMRRHALEQELMRSQWEREHERRLRAEREYDLREAERGKGDRR